MPLSSDLNQPAPATLPADFMSADYHLKMQEFFNQMALEGIKKAERDTMAYLNDYPPRQIVDAEGVKWEALARPLGNDPAFYIPPFKVRSAIVDDLPVVYVQPGVIANAWEVGDTTPTVAGVVNTVDVPKYLTPTTTLQTLRARIEVLPIAEEVEPDYWEVADCTTVEPWDINFYTTTDGQAMQVNPATGAVIQNGIYYRDIATVVLPTAESTSPTITQMRIGPWEVKFCEARLVLQPGASATVNVTITP